MGFIFITTPILIATQTFTFIEKPISLADIIFLSSRDGDWDIYSVDRNGSNLTKIPAAPISVQRIMGNINSGCKKE